MRMKTIGLEWMRMKTIVKTHVFISICSHRVPHTFPISPPPPPPPPLPPALGLSPAWRSGTAPSSDLACHTDGTHSLVLACHARPRCEAESVLCDASQ